MSTPRRCPGMAVAHLAIDPLHNGTIPTYDEFFALESRVGITRQPSQNSTTAAFPSIRRPSGAGDVSSKTVSSVRSAANASASCRLNTSLKLSIVVRVACSVTSHSARPSYKPRGSRQWTPCARLRPVELRLNRSITAAASCCPCRTCYSRTGSRTSWRAAILPGYSLVQFRPPCHHPS